MTSEVLAKDIQSMKTKSIQDISESLESLAVNCIIVAMEFQRVINKKNIIMVENENLEHPVYLGIDSFPLLDDELNIIGGAVVFRDITEQVKMEKLFDEISIRFEHIRKLLERSILVEEMRSEDKQAE